MSLRNRHWFQSTDKIVFSRVQPPPLYVCVWVISPRTHNAVLDAEAQLVPEVRPADEHHGDRRTPDDVHLDPGLRLETLREHHIHKRYLYNRRRICKCIEDDTFSHLKHRVIHIIQFTFIRTGRLTLLPKKTF